MATPFKTFGPFVWMGALFGSLMLTGCTLEAVIGEPDASSVSVVIEVPGRMDWVPGTPEVGAQPGMTAPDALLTDLSGRSVALREVSGRASLVHFWSVASASSLREMAHLDTLNQVYGDRLVIFSVNVGDSADRVRAFVQEKGYAWRILLDTQRQAQSRYDVRNTPVSVFLDKRRIVTANRRGELSLDALYLLSREAMGAHD